MAFSLAEMAWTPSRPLSEAPFSAISNNVTPIHAQRHRPGVEDVARAVDGNAHLLEILPQLGEVQERLPRDPHSGHLFVFRGRRGDLVKVLWYDGQGFCLFSKQLERGRFL